MRKFRRLQAEKQTRMLHCVQHDSPWEGAPLGQFEIAAGWSPIGKFRVSPIADMDSYAGENRPGEAETDGPGASRARTAREYGAIIASARRM